MIAQQVSMKKDIVCTRKEMEKFKKEMEEVKKVRDGDAAKQLSAQKESSQILKEIERLNAEFKAVTTWQSKAETRARYGNDMLQAFKSRHPPIFPHSTHKWSPAYGKTVAKKI